MPAIYCAAARAPRRPTRERKPGLEHVITYEREVPAQTARRGGCWNWILLVAVALLASCASQQPAVAPKPMEAAATRPDPATIVSPLVTPAPIVVQQPESTPPDSADVADLTHTSNTSNTSNTPDSPAIAALAKASPSADTPAPAQTISMAPPEPAVEPSPQPAAISHVPVAPVKAIAPLPAPDDVPSPLAFKIELLAALTPPKAAVAAAAPAPKTLSLPALQSLARSPQDYRLDGARHLYRKFADRIYVGKLPRLVLAVGLLHIDIDARGEVTHVQWGRMPRHSPRVAREIEQLVRSAAPYPAPVHMGGVTYTETWLWDKSGRFQLDTLTQGQD